MTDRPRAPWPARATLALITALGAALRVRQVGLGLSSDEVSDVTHGGLAWFTSGAEVGVNPPLLRVLLNGLFECQGTLVAGRTLSVVCGTLTVLLVADLARRAVRHWAAGLVAAAFVALTPMAIEVSGEFRGYAPTACAIAATLLALAAWVDAAPGPTRRWPGVALAVSAALLPQLHYLTLPLLAGLGLVVLLDRALRPAWPLFVPALLGFLPLAAVAVGQGGARRTPDNGVLLSVQAMTSFDLSVPGPLLDLLVEGGWVSGWYSGERTQVATLVLAVLVVCVLAARHLSATQRALTGAAVGLVAGAAAYGTVHLVRTPATALLIPVFMPLVAGLPWSVRGGRRVVIGAVTVLPLAAAVARSHEVDNRRMDREALHWLFHHRHDLDAVRHGGEVVLRPAGAEVVLHTYLTHHAWGPGPIAPAQACPGDPACFVLDGVRYRSTDGWPRRDGQPRLVVDMWLPRGDEDPTCTRVRDAWPVVWACAPLP